MKVEHLNLWATAVSNVLHYCWLKNRAQVISFPFCLQGTPGYIVFFSPSIVQFSQSVLLESGCLQPTTRASSFHVFSIAAEVHTASNCVNFVGGRRFLSVQFLRKSKTDKHFPQLVYCYKMLMPFLIL